MGQLSIQGQPQWKFTLAKLATLAKLQGLYLSNFLIKVIASKKHLSRWRVHLLVSRYNASPSISLFSTCCRQQLISEVNKLHNLSYASLPADNNFIGACKYHIVDFESNQEKKKLMYLGIEMVDSYEREHQNHYFSTDKVWKILFIDRMSVKQNQVLFSHWS